MGTKKKAAKKTAKKKVVFTPEIDPSLLTVKPRIDTTKLETGMYWKGKVLGPLAEGLIVVEEDFIYLCTNHKSFEGGSIPEDGNTLGFSHSWAFDHSELPEENLTILVNPPKGFKIPEIPIMIDGNKVEYYKGFIEVGCQTITNEIVRTIAKNLKD